MKSCLDSMQGKPKGKKCCKPTNPKDDECYKVEAIVSVDDRGQMVLPKGVREKFGLESGDKLAVVIMEKEGKICCIQLLKAQSFSDPVKDIVGAANRSKR